jgi:hypothetical protein
MGKQAWLDIAEVVDAMRIFPRMLVGTYFATAIWVVVYLTKWYTHIPATERVVEVTAFFGMLTGGLFGLAVYIFKIYTDGGRNWDQQQQKPQE